MCEKVQLKWQVLSLVSPVSDDLVSCHSDVRNFSPTPDMGGSRDPAPEKLSDPDVRHQIP